MRGGVRAAPLAAATLLGAMVLGATAVRADVTITEETDEGIACFKIVTDRATYYYDKAGAGFTSLIDTDGNDWIGFHPEGSAGVPNGQSGWYRGIPNMGLNDFGHPGYDGATSTTSDPLGEARPSVSIASSKGSWSVTWEFFSTYAVMTVHSVGANYWFLYEGTPGGAVGADDDCLRASGETNSLSGSWEGDVVNSSGAADGHEWVAFVDGPTARSLFLVHDDDSITDRYYLMDPMTVFGFGRHAPNIDRLMSQTPATLHLGLVESRDAADIEAAVEAAVQGGSTPLPADRDDCDRAVRDHRAGSASDSAVRAVIRRYRRPS